MCGRLQLDNAIMPGGPALPSTSRTVLIVEDNPDHALLVRLAAQRVDPDLDVHVVGDGQEALAYLSGEGGFADRTRHPLPQLLILDLVMPRLDGFGVLAWLGERPEWEALPVVVLTSSVSPRDEERVLELGAVSFETKPADLDRLGEQVRSLVTQWLP